MSVATSPMIRRTAPLVVVRLLILWVHQLFPSSVSAGDVFLAYPSPVTGEVWDGGTQMYPAVLTALDDINADPALLPGSTLRVARYDHQCNPGLGVRGLVEVVQNAAARPLVGILDGGCSSVAKSVTDIGRWYNLVSMSGVASTPLLSDKSQYPMFLRTTSSFVHFVPAAIGILRHYGWTRVATIAENQGLYLLPMDAFKVAAANQGIDIVTTATLNLGESAVASVDTVVTYGTSIIFVQSGPFVMRKLFCEALRRGAVGAGKVWLVPGWFSAGWWRPVAADQHNCTEAELHNATQGYLSIEFSAIAADKQRVATTNEYPSAVQGRILAKASAMGVPTIELGYTSYDAVWAWALAVHDLVHGKGMALSDLSKDGVAQIAVKDRLFATDFHGISGHVTVDPLTGDRGGQHIRIENQVNGVEMLVGLCTPDGTVSIDPTVVVWHGSPIVRGAFTNVGDAFAPTGRGGAQFAPFVDSIVPSVLSPQGGLIELRGSNFRPGKVAVSIGKEKCADVLFISATRLRCHAPPGSGGPLEVGVTCAGQEGEPRNLLSYKLPDIFALARSWTASGAILNITGNYFIAGATWCKLVTANGLEFDPVPATVVNTNLVMCAIRFESTSLAVGTMSKVAISNDNRQRWTTGLSMNTPIKWYGGAAVPVAPSTRVFPAEVVIGGVIPLDYRAKQDEAQKVVEEIRRAFDIAAASVNQAQIFPGQTRLRVQPLLVAPVSSGRPEQTAEIIAAAFARNGTKNASGAGGQRHANHIGIAGGFWSSNTIPIVRAASNPFRLPVISYDSWTSELDSTRAYPYFTRVSRATSEVCEVTGTWLRALSFQRIGAITENDPFTRNVVDGLEQNMVQNGGSVLWRETFSGLPTTDSVSKGEIKRTAQTISVNLAEAKSAGVRILFVLVKGRANMLALLSALNTTGFLAPGHAIMTLDWSTEITSLITEGIEDERRLSGWLAISAKVDHFCQASWCPAASCGDHCLVDTTTLNQAHDAVIVLAYAIAPLFRRDGGRAYLDGVQSTRDLAMRQIRAFNEKGVTASGPLSFEVGMNRRTRWDFSNEVYNLVAAPFTPPGRASSLQRVLVGRVLDNGFEQTAPILWPGNTSKIPQDSTRASSDPAVLTVGWVVETCWSAHSFQQKRALYAQQALDEINADQLTLPNTHLVLEKEFVCDNNDTVRATSTIAKRAKAAGRPVVAFLGSGSSHSIGVLDANILSVPLIGFYTGSADLSNATKYPNFVRLWPSSRVSQHGYRKAALTFGWTRIAVIADANDPWSTDLFHSVNGTDPGDPDNFQPLLNAGEILPNPRAAFKIDVVYASVVDWKAATNATLNTMVAAIKAADAKVFYFLLGNVDLERLLLHGLEHGIFGPGYQLMLSSGQGEAAVRAMDPRAAAALDGSVLVLSRSLDRDSVGFKRSAAFWASRGAMRTSTSASSSEEAQGGYFNPVEAEIATLYDSLLFTASAIERCLENGDSPIGGWQRVMPHFRKTAIDGIAGTPSIKAGSNDNDGVVFNLMVGENPTARPHSLAGPFVWKIAAVIGPRDLDVELCRDQEMGENCALRVSRPERVRCSATLDSVEVEWDPAVVDEASNALLTGYRVTFRAADSQTFQVVDKTKPTRATLVGPGLRRNEVYGIVVEALFDNGQILSKAATCLVPQDGLPCVPPPQDQNARSICGCSATEFHSKGMPGVQPRDWACDQCETGMRCDGRTAESLATQPGFFAAPSVDKDGNELRPKLYPCPRGKRACPGNALLTQVISLAEAQSSGVIATNIARACDFTKHRTGSHAGGADGLGHSRCQCSPGTTGMLCESCQSAADSDVDDDPHDWVFDGISCKRCSLTQREASAIVGSLIFGTVLALFAAGLTAYYLMRPSKLERKFVRAFANMDEIGGVQAVEEFFGPSARQGVRRDQFTTACVDKLSASVGSAETVRRGAEKLWVALDENEDGVIDVKEFVTFLYHLRGNKARSGKCRTLFAGAVGWWTSLRSLSIRTVIITHFQLLSSAPRSFPDVLGQGIGLAAVDRAAESVPSRITTSAGVKPLQNSTLATGQGTTSLALDAFKVTVVQIGAFFADLNITMLQFVRCFIGPRHASKLVLSTSLVIGGLLFTKAARRLLILFHKHVIRLNAHIVSEFNRYGYRIQLLLIFLVYPTITSITLRTFVCDEYPDSDGRPAYWLADDKVVRCDWHTAGSWNYGYQGMWVYAICMVFCVVFGLPALVLRILVPWRFNDRMYTVAEDGTEKPTDAALAELGALVMFKKSSWAMAIVDMFFKLVLTSLIGVLFHDHQIMGLAFGWMCCGCIIFVYAVQKPYIYEPANWIAVSSYFAILTGYTGAVADRLVKDYYVNPLPGLEVVIFISWLLPFLLALGCQFPTIVFFIPRHLWRQASRCSHCTRILRQHAPSLEQKEVTAIIYARKADSRRVACVLGLIRTLLPLAREAKRRAAGTRSKNEGGGSGGQVVVHPAGDNSKVDLSDLEDHLLAMANAFRNGGTAAAGTSTKTLSGKYEPVEYLSFVEAETHAISLSRRAFPWLQADDQNLARAAKIKPGQVLLAFAQRKKMWSTKDPLTWQLRSVAKVIAEGSGKKLETYPSMNDIYTWHLIIAAMLKPGADFGTIDLQPGRVSEQISTSFVESRTRRRTTRSSLDTLRAAEAHRSSRESKSEQTNPMAVAAAAANAAAGGDAATAEVGDEIVEGETQGGDGHIADEGVKAKKGGSEKKELRSPRAPLASAHSPPKSNVPWMRRPPTSYSVPGMSANRQREVIDERRTKLGAQEHEIARLRREAAGNRDALDIVTRLPDAAAEIDIEIDEEA